MSPSKPMKDIKVQVPRHNSQRLGPAVTAEVDALARKQNTLVDVRQTAYDPSSALAQAIDSASEWNSLLMTARAERGPQWDIGTQQYAIQRYHPDLYSAYAFCRFLVDEKSDLYYDPSPLLEYQKENRPEGEDGDRTTDKQAIPTSEPGSAMGTPQTRRNPQLPPQPGHMFSPRHHGQFTPQGLPYPNMAPIPSSQFYGNGGDPSIPSPLRIGSLGMSVDNMGGMGGMGMASPDVRRRMTRGMGMGEDSYGGMH
ncbi:hypothetical protein NLI96_g10209 [Meripilus lineatus]|uniref:Uncharacterized protein n=1 Tax=Meripilus lineatus TaxID=2056292 RepID=A0AAD5YEJ7_9APHY|nr:hypothetical protein NLI96_g10209 [Physisporinus lineatus]